MRLPPAITGIGDGIRTGLSRSVDRVGSWLLRGMGPWERLPVPAQVAIAFPSLSVILFLFHLGPLGQPLLRAIFYGIFWSILATPAIVVATQNELRKRERRGGSREPHQP